MLCFGCFTLVVKVKNEVNRLELVSRTSEDRHAAALQRASDEIEVCFCGCMCLCECEFWLWRSTA